MMKIGTFSQKYDVSFYTIRFYIKEGLLLPERKNNQFYFDLRCEEDMLLIMELRECRFSLKEMSRILSIKRLSGFRDEESIHFINGMMTGKMQELQQEIQDLSLSIRRLTEKKSQMEQMTEESQEERSYGIPVSFLNYLRCPHCHSPLELEQSKLRGMKVVEGRLLCSCGYEAQVVDGILTNDTEIEKAANWCSTNVKIEKYSQEYLNMMFQCYNWMYNEMLESMEKKSGQVILCNGENGAEFLYQYMNKLGKENLYIITEVSSKMIQNIRHRMNQSLEDYQILYLVSEDAQLPIQSGCVNLLVDDSISWYDMFDHPDFYINKVRRLLSGQAQVIGFYPCYSRKSLSVKNIKLLYPQSNVGQMNWTSMKQNFLKNKLNMVSHKLIGDVKECGEWARYHVTGECVHMRVYHGVFREDGRGGM